MTGRDATTSAIRQLASTPAQAPRWLHIAAHAVIDDAHPELSRIVLRDSDEYGGWYMGEIASASIPSDLVTLACCSTARGVTLPGEGTIGFARALLAAGAGGVCTSLWDVHDASASTIMELFYERLARALTPVAALREAQCSLIASEYSDPIHWAGFQLIGS
jgi:CHAT domain-containing protein